MGMVIPVIMKREIDIGLIPSTYGLFFYKDYLFDWPGRIPKKYQTKEVKERWCYLRFSGIDAEMSILADIEKWEAGTKRENKLEVYV